MMLKWKIYNYSHFFNDRCCFGPFQGTFWGCVCTREENETGNVFWPKTSYHDSFNPHVSSSRPLQKHHHEQHPTSAVLLAVPRHQVLAVMDQSASTEVHQRLFSNLVIWIIVCHCLGLYYSLVQTDTTLRLESQPVWITETETRSWREPLHA